MTPCCVVVLGIPRSGTSTVAGVLHHLGVMMGEHFPIPSEMNPKGFFEDLEIIQLHGRFLDYGAYQETVILDDDPDKLAAYEAFIRKREALVRTWGFKDRYTPFLLHIARRYITQSLRVIVTERPFHESVHSWAMQRKCQIREAMKIMADTLYARDIELAEFYGPVLKVPYHKLLNNPAHWVQRIALFVDKEATQEAVDFVDPTLRRYG